MRRFNVTVNGVSYDVVVEEIGATAPTATPAAASVAAPAPAAAPAPKTQSVGTAGSVAVKAPMPGTILKVNTSVGQAVKKGDVLCVLEAMKMENEIMAPCDGTVAGVSVANGASVESGSLLCSLN